MSPDLPHARSHRRSRIMSRRVAVHPGTCHARATVDIALDANGSQNPSIPSPHARRTTANPSDRMNATTAARLPHRRSRGPQRPSAPRLPGLPPRRQRPSPPRRTTDPSPAQQQPQHHHPQPPPNSTPSSTPPPSPTTKARPPSPASRPAHSATGPAAPPPIAAFQSPTTCLPTHHRERARPPRRPRPRRPQIALTPRCLLPASMTSLLGLRSLRAIMCRRSRRRCGRLRARTRSGCLLASRTRLIGWILLRGWR